MTILIRLRAAPDGYRVGNTLTIASSCTADLIALIASVLLSSIAIITALGLSILFITLMPAIISSALSYIKRSSQVATGSHSQPFTIKILQFLSPLIEEPSLAAVWNWAPPNPSTP